MNTISPPKILAVVVAYHPDIERLRHHISLFSPAVEQVLVWKNSEFDFDAPGIIVKGDGTNQGIAYALNEAWKWARERGYDYLLTMDQDSQWEDFPLYLQMALAGEKNALYGPCINQMQQSEDFVPCDFLITSGMLVPLSVLEKVGGYRADFFVDVIDVDFVLHAKSLGIPSYRVGAGRLYQQFGKRRKTCGFYVYDYPPERLYGIFRNHILTIRRYPKESQALRKMFVRRWVLSRIPRILLGEKNKWEKMKAIYRGVKEGFAANLGAKCNEI